MMAGKPSSETEKLPRESAVVADTGPAARKDADVPWWLMESSPQPPIEHWRRAKPREPAQPASAAPGIEPQFSPARFLENASIGSGDLKFQRPAAVAPVAAPTAVPVAAEEAAPEPKSQVAADESESETESRLSGLRGLLISPGLKNLGKARESAMGEESILPMESEQGPIEPGRKFTPISEPVPVASAPAEAKEPSASERPVATEPEFPPPKEFIPLKDRDEGHASGSAARGDGEDAFDDLQILPSTRGQYKSRG